jgi:hypothetical protein
MEFLLANAAKAIVPARCGQGPVGRGELFRWPAGMAVIAISARWLAFGHPDTRSRASGLQE